MSNNYKAISFSESASMSNSDFRKIVTDNFICLTKFNKISLADPSKFSSGWINLLGDKNDGFVNRLPLLKQNSSDLAGYDNIIYLDNSNILCAKIAGKIYVLSSNDKRYLVKEYGTLPSASTIPVGYSEIVSNLGKLKWYNKLGSKWETIESK